MLSDEAFNDGSVTVEEVSNAGSVADLSVENKGDALVLFLEGEELLGAKQNRILNTSVLVPGHTKMKIPVSCVEQGRWQYSSRGFSSSGSHSPSKLRYALKASVARSLQAKRGHRADQSQVWREVSRQQRAFSIPSCTSAMADTFSSCADRVAEFREHLTYVKGATGMVLAVGSRVVALDLFDKPSTCETAWPRLLTGVVLDAMEASNDRAQVNTRDMERLLDVLRHAAWRRVEAVGEGQEYRVAKGGYYGSALSMNEVVVHTSVLVGE
jgi:hypothetical protein